jgi:CDGSH-type Zn-finger protein
MSDVVIRCRENGPLVITGHVKIVDHQGRELPLPVHEKGNIALCRCGHSARKPFCDGTHKTCGFRSGEATEVGPG